MKKAAMYIFLCLLLSCNREETYLPPVGGNAPVDTGIYERDSTRSDAFCDFEFIPNSQNCWSVAPRVYHDCHYNLLFTRYGNGWTGADATYSIGLPDGRILWLFGDTFLGTVRADRSREGSKFLRNSLVVQQGDELETIYQVVNGNPSAYFSPTDPAEWYWPMDGTIHNGELQIMLARFGQTGTAGMWSFEYVGIDRAIVSLSDLKLQSITPVQPTGYISYGASVMEDDNFIYIYGISFTSAGKRLHAARAPNGDLTAAWEYYDGQGWISTPSDYPMVTGISDQFSVFKDNGKYYLVSQLTFFSKRIDIVEADSPVGPWRNRRTLYCTPESGGDIFTYNAFVHPELSENGELRISYNINSFNFSDIFDDADLYRPKFIRVDNWR